MNKIAFSILIASSSLVSTMTEGMPIQNYQEGVSVINHDMKSKKHKKTPQDLINNVQQHYVPTYVCATATGSLGNAQNVAYQAPIIFNNTVSVSGQAVNDSTGVITLAVPGTYEITFGGQWNSSDQHSLLALRLNEDIVSGSALPGGGWRTLTLVLDVKVANSKLQVVNNSVRSFESITLAGDGDSLDNATTAFVTIRKL